MDGTYQRELEPADRPADWQERERLRKAAEAQRDTQLARIDDLAASFAAIERQGEATSVFKELTRILQTPGQGVAQALAYIETRRPDIQGEVDRIAEGAQTRIRARLQPLLTSAGLYRTQGNAEVARDRYAQILARAPDWSAALHESLGLLIEQGDQSVIRGSLPDANRDYREAQARAERLLQSEPDNPNLAARPLGESQQGRRHPVRPGGSRGGAEVLPGEPGSPRAPGRRRPATRKRAWS